MVRVLICILERSDFDLFDDNAFDSNNEKKNIFQRKLLPTGERHFKLIR